MNRDLRWYDHLTLNSYWLGLNTASGIITPLLLPALVVLYMPVEYKNTYLATVSTLGLAVAMLVQPIAGMLSDRSTARLGRRRPFILVGALLNIVFLAVIGLSKSFTNSPLDAALMPALGFTAAYGVLLLGIVLLQVSSNIGHGALQGLIPDLVPPQQRGRASGVKAVFELLPVLLVFLVGGWIDRGQIWPVIILIMVMFAVTALITLIFVKEQPLAEAPKDSLREPVLRIVALTVIFFGITRLVIWLLGSGGGWLGDMGASLPVVVAVMGAAGLIGMAGSILLGVYLGAWVGVGKEARQQRSFIWWVINRLLFLAAIGSVRNFAQYYLSDVLHMEQAATMTTILLGVVALFLIPSAIAGGLLSDRTGRRRLVLLSAVIAAAGTGLLLVSASLPLVIASGAVIGIGSGLFMATNWALGTDLVPPEQAGKYLGISNLAGAGAGIVGTGIGGPIADYFNLLQPGLGYTVIYAMYGGLFLLSIAALSRVKSADPSAAPVPQPASLP